MTFTLVELDDISGKEATIYSLLNKESNKTLYDKFIEENKASHLDEIKDITSRLHTIGNITGSKHNFFKHNEGNLGDGVCALYDVKKKNLRLYCIRYGKSLLIIGGGGVKPKNIRSLQESDKLKSENYILREAVKEITKKMKEKEIRIETDEIGEYFDGNLTIELNN